MLVDGVLHVDNSCLKTVACSTRALMRHHHGYTSPEERSYLKSGSAGHAAIAHWLKHGKAGPALDVFEKDYREWAQANVASDDRLSYVNTSLVLNRWFETHARAQFPFAIAAEHVEIYFQLPLDDGIVFMGRIDAIGRQQDTGALYNGENKFTWKISAAWKDDWQTDSGITGYQWAVEELLGEPVVGTFINAIEFSRLPSDPSRKCKEHATPYAECGRLHANYELFTVARTPGMVEEWRRTAIHLAKRYRDLIRNFPKLEDIHRVRMQGLFDRQCPRCEFRNFCILGRQVATVDAMLAVEHWNPLEKAETVMVKE